MTEKEFDIVIVGSGAGGGAVAKELSAMCADGVKIALLEWGPKFKEDEFTGRELEMTRRLYFDGGGMLSKDRSMTIAMGKAYGGSTVMYTGTSLTIQPATVKRWDVPGLDADDLKRRSMKYARQNGVHLLGPGEINDNNRLFRQACESLGYKVRQFPVNLKGCRGSGLCNLGCPNAAKQGTHRVQLPAAERAGVEVVTRCRVDRVEDRTLYAEVQEGDMGHPSKWAPGRYRIKAKVVVCSAGAVNSPALLHRSGLADRLPALGRWFTCQPALILIGRHPKPITGFYGHPKSYYCDEFAESKRFLLETCMYFPFVTAKNLAGFGAEHSRLMGAFDRLQMILVLALDAAEARNRITVDAEGNPVVDYRLSDKTLDSLHAAMSASARIFFAAGAECVHVPAGSKFLIEKSEQDRLEELIPRSGLKPGKASITAAHLMGGCRMGADTASSVADVWGRVHGLPWLRVADASLFPKAAEINPYLTIMAFADRVAEKIREEARDLLNAPAGAAR